MRKKLRINELTKAEKIALVKEICRICEKQYRKGYQHGFIHGKEKLVNEDDVNKFRWKGSEQNYSKVTYPPYFNGNKDSISRVSCELGMPDMEFLKSLFWEVENYEKR